MIYYAPSLATGIILRDLGEYWEYSIRSPKASDHSYYLISIRRDEKVKFDDAIDVGRFEYYRGGQRDD